MKNLYRGATWFQQWEPISDLSQHPNEDTTGHGLAQMHRFSFYL